MESSLEVVNNNRLTRREKVVHEGRWACPKSILLPQKPASLALGIKRDFPSWLSPLCGMFRVDKDQYKGNGGNFNRIIRAARHMWSHVAFFCLGFASLGTASFLKRTPKEGLVISFISQNHGSGKAMVSLSFLFFFLRIFGYMSVLSCILLPIFPFRKLVLTSSHIG